jgi:CoA:oxalate CoA-transferase
MAGWNAPLNGIRVLDLGRHQAGPRCAQVLARLGAEVIKIERLEGEETRAHGPWANGQSAYFVQYNSGKKSLAMDLRQEQARKILRELVKVSDVFLQNFRPGTIDKMGFGYDVLKALNPRIIMVNVSAYGQFGPYSERIGYDPIGQAMAGIMMVTGKEGMPPIQTGVPIIDRTTALHAAIGTLAAIVERSVSGKGQTIDVCLADSGYSLTEIPITAQHAGGDLPPRGAGGGAPPTGIYPCKNGWVLISAGDQHQWPRVCRALGKPEWLDDPRFTARAERQKHGAEVAEAVNAVISDKTMQESIAHFTKHDITAAPVNTIAQAEADPHPWERRTMVEVPDPIAGTIAVSGDYWHFSRSEAVVGSTPTVGQHTEELLVKLLGFTPDQVAELREARVVA